MRIVILKVYSDTWCFAKVATDINGLELEKGVGFIATTQKFKKGDVVDVSDFDVKVEQVDTKINDEDVTMPRIRIA
jgi:hypothetical protein|tara:strand:+ start:577 stop:804 length:228 start_codon:yes stop_codon:yes gene_type:complete